MPHPNVYQGFVVTQHNGRWGKPVSSAEVFSVSCRSGSCAAGGTVGFDYDGIPEGAFVVSERNGRWSKANDLRGPAARGQVSSLSCASAGNCGAGG